MKSTLIALCLLSFSAFSMDMPKCATKPFDLLKCKSPKLGTVWASFGHVMTSENLEPTFFVVELGYFAADASHRKEFGTDFKQALTEIPTRVSPGSGSLVFNVPVKQTTRTVTLTWIQTDRRDDHSFMGNAKINEPGAEEVNDLLACTLN